MVRSLRGLVLGLFVATASFAGTVAQAQSAEATALIEKVEAKYKTVTSIRAGVVQTTVNALGSETVEGELVLQRPDKMRWSFGDRVFVTNGAKMWIYSAEDNQVIEYDDLGGAKSTADSLLTSLDKLQDIFDVKVLSTSAGGHHIELRPKSDAQFKKVELYLDGALMVVSVVIVDTFDNITNLALTNVKLNAPTDKSVFEFATPKGASVVKGTTN